MGDDDDPIVFLPRVVDKPDYRPSLAGWLYVIGAPLKPRDESTDDAILWCLDRHGWWLVRNNIRLRRLSDAEAYEADCAVGRQQPTQERWEVDTQAIFAELDLVPFDAPSSKELERRRLEATKRKGRPGRVLPWKKRSKG